MRVCVRVCRRRFEIILFLRSALCETNAERGGEAPLRMEACEKSCKRHHIILNTQSSLVRCFMGARACSSLSTYVTVSLNLLVPQYARYLSISVSLCG